MCDSRPTIVVELQWCSTTSAILRVCSTLIDNAKSINCLCIRQTVFILRCCSLQSELSLVMVMVVAATETCWNSVILKELLDSLYSAFWWYSFETKNLIDRVFGILPAFSDVYRRPMLSLVCSSHCL
jgi:hypothetical protein